jgi:hypothetical protein
LKFSHYAQELLRSKCCSVAGTEAEWKMAGELTLEKTDLWSKERMKIQ